MRGLARYRDDGSSACRFGFAHNAGGRLLSLRATSQSGCTVMLSGQIWTQLTHATANASSNSLKG